MGVLNTCVRAVFACIGMHRSSIRPHAVSPIHVYWETVAASNLTAVQVWPPQRRQCVFGDTCQIGSNSCVPTTKKHTGGQNCLVHYLRFIMWNKDTKVEERKALKNMKHNLMQELHDETSNAMVLVS